MRFARFEALASCAVDREFGERVRVEPQRKSGEFSHGGPDPDRTAFEATAVVDLTPALLTTERTAAHPTTVPSETVHVSFATSALPILPRQGDIIVALERDGRTFLVAVTEPDGMGRVLCRCRGAKKP